MIGTATLGGWLAGSRELTALKEHYIPMAPDTAVLFVLLGLSLCALAVRARSARLFLRTALFLSFLMASARLAEYMTGGGIGVDQWGLTVGGVRGAAIPTGKMAFFTALAFLLASVALFSQSFSRRPRDVDDLARAMAVVVTLVGLVFSLGYLYDSPLLYGGQSIPMALPSAVGFIVLGLSIVVPMTLRDRAERRKQDRSLAQIDGAFEHATVGIALLAPNGRWLRVNRALCEIVGHTERELLATTSQAITHPDDVDADLAYVRRLVAGEIQTYEVQKRYIHKRGHAIWSLLSVSLVRDADEVPMYFISHIQDITERKRVHAALTRPALVFDTISDGVIVMDVEGRVTDWNPAAERMFGYSKEEMLGRDVERIHHPRLAGALEREIRRGLARDGRWSGELTFLRKDGVEGVADVVVVVQRDPAGAPTAWIGVNRDITERKRTEEALRRSEEQLRQAQRLEAVGQLAGGVAHDFNNILTAISSYSELLLEELHDSDARREDVIEIRKAADRAAALTRQLLAFSRRQMLQPIVLDLNTTVADMEKMLRRLVMTHIKLVTHLAPNLGHVRADPGQMEQVLVNLVVNSRDAMLQGGVLTIETANVELKDSYAAQGGLRVPPGAYVRVVVSDTGCGMDEAIQARIFEPFFTTKEPGRGTGLGLPTVYGIVKQSGGYIWCYSEPSRGTAFKIYLPRVDQPTEVRKGNGNGAVTRRGTETILLVEDEEAVRSVVRRILDRHGYTVLEASNGPEALRLCERREGPINLMLTDMVMPEMSGTDLARRVGAISPHTRVLYMSGYTEDAALRQSFLAPGAAFIEKPFTPEALAHKVREVLDARPEQVAVLTT